ncbi:tellurium resistance protein TerC [Elizabethkingia bruuniana]|uniref:MauE/DoxX family redox-associated membrane protein n=1 Tax=Elizabethkingia bruuniana TaxID=1756149 RepID=UPI000999F49F|nr:MauE/DoxX family redox-associated membrane protein [Elizabethkingia bruuniana]OPC66458.1 tellurium resistance protein TerC [Elizabethkingia bruuniana]
MKKAAYIPVIVSYFFVLLFCYAAISKMLDFENFQVQLAQSPLLSAYAGFVSYAVLIMEFATAILLCIQKTNRIGLYASLGLMAAFTIYIYLILNYSDFVPCSCGGILEKLGWTEHLIFNIGCVALAITAILIKQKQEFPDLRLLKPVWISSIIMILSSGVVVSLFLSSEYIIKKENNFTRRFLQHPLEDEDAKIDLGFNSYYFAGYDDSYIYLGNVTAPMVLTTVDTALKSKSRMKIRLDKSDYPFRSIQMRVKYPYYYLYDGDVPVIYRGSLKDSFARTISYNDAYFTQLAVIDSSRFAIRTLNSRTQNYTIGSLDLSKSQKVRLYPSLIEKQTDGVFDSDGKLIIDPKNKKLSYAYYYRNQFLVMDSNINLINRLHTIDTISWAQVRAVALSDGRHKMGAPPLQVNKNMVIAHNILFNQSNLRGKFEDRDAWKQAAIIDCYNTDRQNYIGSFYISNRGKNKIAHFLITDCYLYILSGNELVRFRFAQSLLRQLKSGDAENLNKRVGNNY